MMWLVTVKKPGIMPSMFAVNTNMNSEKTRGKELHPLGAGRVAERARDEIMQNLGDRLGAARNDGAVARGEEQPAHDHRGGSDHEQGRVREIDDRDDGLDLELLDRAGHDPSASRAGIAVSCPWPIEVGASPLVVIPGGSHHAGGSHQVEHPGAEAENETDDEPPWGRCRTAGRRSTRRFRPRPPQRRIRPKAVRPGRALASRTLNGYAKPRSAVDPRTPCRAAHQGLQSRRQVGIVGTGRFSAFSVMPLGGIRHGVHTLRQPEKAGEKPGPESRAHHMGGGCRCQGCEGIQLSDCW